MGEAVEGPSFNPSTFQHFNRAAGAPRVSRCLAPRLLLDGNWQHAKPKTFHEHRAQKRYHAETQRARRGKGRGKVDTPSICAKSLSRPHPQSCPSHRGEQNRASASSRAPHPGGPVEPYASRRNCPHLLAPTPIAPCKSGGPDTPCGRLRLRRPPSPAPHPCRIPPLRTRLHPSGGFRSRRLGNLRR